MMNLLITVPVNVRDEIENEISSDEGQRSYSRMLHNRVLNGMGGYRIRISGGRNFHVFDFVARTPDEVQAFLNSFPDAIVLGVWDFETGELLRSHAFLESFYRAHMAATEDGEPTEAGDTHLWYGQASRQFI